MLIAQELPSASTKKNTSAEELLAEDSFCVSIDFFTTKDSKCRTEDVERLIEVLLKKRYTVYISRQYVDENGFNEIKRENAFFLLRGNKSDERKSLVEKPSLQRK